VAFLTDPIATGTELSLRYSSLSNIQLDVRPYRGGDFEAVTSIWLAAWRTTGIASPVTLEDLRSRWPDEIARGWVVDVAMTAGLAVGFLAVHGNRIEQLFIAPGAQGRGIGKRLLDHAKLWMVSGFHLDPAAESRACHFYEREGLRRGEESIHPRFGHRTVRYDWHPRDKYRAASSA
jgi:GNAT superfamily N-acetyltransferase